jgi:hypothetical protein
MCVEVKKAVVLALRADISELLAAIAEASLCPKLFLEVFNGFLGLPEFLSKLVRIEADNGIAAGAGELRVLLKPFDFFVGSIAAVRAREVKSGLVK